MSETVDEAPDGWAVMARTLRELSPDARRFLRAHPDAARHVLTAALEQAAADHEPAAGADLAVLPEALVSCIVRRPPRPDLIAPEEAAARLQVSRTTVLGWLGNHRLLGWHSAGGDILLPAEQILGPGRIVPGLPEMARNIPNAELAWAFLSQE